MSAAYILRRTDGRPVGTLAEMETLVRRLFPAARFRWTTDGPAVQMQAQERVDRAYCDEIRAGLRPPYLAPEARMAFREGVAEGPGYRLSFWLKLPESGVTVYVDRQGAAPEVDHGLAALEAATGAKLQECAADSRRTRLAPDRRPSP